MTYVFCGSNRDSSSAPPSKAQLLTGLCCVCGRVVDVLCTCACGQAKLKKSTTAIAKADLACVNAKSVWEASGKASDEILMDALRDQLRSLRAARDGLLTSQNKELAASEAKFDRMKETRGEMDALKKAKIDKAKKAAEALQTKAPAAGGASAADGAAALRAAQDAAKAKEAADALEKGAAMAADIDAL
jgi:hypothetical protein